MHEKGSDLPRGTPALLSRTHPTGDSDGMEEKTGEACGWGEGLNSDGPGSDPSSATSLKPVPLHSYL